MFHVQSPFPIWLQGQLDLRGWSPADLARASKTNPSTISNVLNEERRPGPELCRALASALDLPEAVVFFHAGLLSELPDTGLKEEILLAVEKRLNQLPPDVRQIMLASFLSQLEAAMKLRGQGE